MHFSADSIKRLSRLFDALELIGIFSMLFIAFAFQILLHELPCPLCLLQRLGFLAVSFGLILNLRFGFRPSHYAITLLSALYTAFVALRQIALHVVPGTGSYGDPIFGLHLYTWSFIVAMLIVIFTSFALGFDRQYGNRKYAQRLSHILFAILVVLLVSNIVSVFLQCGFAACADDPVSYRILDMLRY